MKKYDWVVIFLMLTIFSFGSLVLFSVDKTLFYSQLKWFGIGLIVFVLMANFDYRIFDNFYPSLYIISIFFLLLTFVLGNITRGSIRWIKIGNLTLQFSELAKPLLVLHFASMIKRLDLSKIKNILVFLLSVLLPVFLIFKQPDLGNALVVFFMGLGMMYFGGIKKKYFVIGILVFLCFLPFSYKILKPYQKERIVSFISPNYDPLGSGYNLLQAKIAIGTGQFFGEGLGGGSQSQLRFLPERHSDFIFACLAEELGFVGASIILVCFFILISRFINIAHKSSDLFGSWICLGTTTIFFFQIFVNIGMNLGLTPVTGITLPLVSYGGSSLLSSMWLLGLIQAIKQQAQKEKAIEIS